MNKTEFSYHETEFEAMLARNNSYQRLGNALEFTLISPPNHDRPTFKLEVVYDADRVSVMRSGRRADPWSGVGL